MKRALYVVITDPVTGYRRVTEACVSAAVPFIQLRMKGSSSTEIQRTAAMMRDITAGTATRLIINDYPDIAAAVDADGVHLGQNDLSLETARKRWQNTGKIFGLSTHNTSQAAAALTCRPSYIGVGPLFATPTKQIPDPVLGLNRAAFIVRNMESKHGIPCFAIGGINSKNLIPVLQSGISNVAVVRAVCQSSDPERTLRDLLQIMKEISIEAYTSDLHATMKVSDLPPDP